MPLSIWSINKTFENIVGDKATDASKDVEEHKDVDVAAGKKRRASSQSSKQRELLFGEVWRAKNLPNDALSLPRHPLIRSIIFLPSSDGLTSSHEGTGSGTDELKAAVAVGTKDGLVRVYEPANKKPKHVHEWHVVPKNQGAIRVLKLSTKDKILFAGDSARNLFAIDIKTGRILFQYKGMLS